MKNMIQGNAEYKQHEKIFEHIADISFSKNIAPFSTDSQDIVAMGKQDHIDESEQIKQGEIGPFIRTVIMNLPLAVHNQEGKTIDVNCKIWSRTMQNLISDDIIQNIRKAGSIGILDVDFEFTIGVEEYSEYHFGQESFYKNIKQHVIQFIKENPQIERIIVENYCDGLSSTLGYMKSKKPVIAQREKTTRDLHLALGMDEDFVLSKNYKTATDTLVLGSYETQRKEIFSKKQKKVFEELLRIGNDLRGFESAHITKAFIEDMEKNTNEIQQIIEKIKKGNQEISLDSKFFFLDNGDNLYDDVIEKSAYNEYYKQELQLIQESREAIQPYLKTKYIGLGCGNGKKDYSIISENVDIGTTWTPPSFQRMISKVVLMDSSLRSLSKAEKLMSKNRGERGVSFGGTTIVFTQEWIDSLLQNDYIKTLTSATSYPKETMLNMPDIRESSNMFTLFGGTFGNFETYQTTFLKQMDEIMNPGDILCISLFNPPQETKEQEHIVSKYDTPQNTLFIKNFFIKLGIPEEAIDVHVSYKDDTIHIDAEIHGKENKPILMHVGGEDVPVNDGTIFHCITSQRMDEDDVKKTIDQSQTSLKIIDKITTSGNPFPLYMISK